MNCLTSSDIMLFIAMTHSSPGAETIDRPRALASSPLKLASRLSCCPLSAVEPSTAHSHTQHPHHICGKEIEQAARF